MQYSSPILQVFETDKMDIHAHIILDDQVIIICMKLNNKEFVITLQGYMITTVMLI